METRTIRWERGQLVDAPALPTPVPGLSIVTCPDCYSLSHDRSGLALVYADSPEQLAVILPKLAHIDWTQSGDDVRADPASLDAVEVLREFQKTCGGFGWNTYPDASDLPGETT